MENLVAQLYILAIFMCFYGLFRSWRYRPLKTREQQKEGVVIYRSLSPGDAERDMKNAIIVDVRYPEEYALSRLTRSKTLPLKTLPEQAEKKLKNKSAKIFVYCQSGQRSKKAVKKLYGMGYTDVYDIGAMKNFKDRINRERL